MAGPWFRFSWIRFPHGVAVRSGIRLNGLDDVFLVPRGPGELYSPADEAPGLLQELQSLPSGDVEAYAAFASRYGFLAMENPYLMVEDPIDRTLRPFESVVPAGVPVQWVDFNPPLGPEGCLTQSRWGSQDDEPIQEPYPDNGVSAFSAVDWEMDVLNLSTAVDLYGALKSERRATGRSRHVEKFRVATGFDWYRAHLSPSALRIYESERDQDGVHRGNTFEGFERDLVVLPNPSEFEEDPIGSCWDYLALSIHFQLEKDTVLEFDMKERRLRATTRNLKGFAWFQLAQEIDKRSSPRHCPRCNRWFIINARGKRKHDRYCSPRCRQATYRLRTKARQLRRDGASLREIARTLDANISTVKEWTASNVDQGLKRS